MTRLQERERERETSSARSCLSKGLNLLHGYWLCLPATTRTRATATSSPSCPISSNRVRRHHKKTEKLRGKKKLTWVQENTHGIALKVSTPPVGLLFAGRDPMLREGSSSSGVAIRKYGTNRGSRRTISRYACDAHQPWGDEQNAYLENARQPFRKEFWFITSDMSFISLQ